jgi:hypothetical protein
MSIHPIKAKKGAHGVRFGLPPAKLLLALCVVWAIAGLNVFSIGVAVLIERHDWWIILTALGILVVFAGAIFPPVIKRYTMRVAEMGGSTRHIWEALDAKGYLFMVGMMSLGVLLRTSGIAPDWFIALFYSGLGAALLLASLGFLHNYFALSWRTANPNVAHAHAHGHWGHSRKG